MVGCLGIVLVLCSLSGNEEINEDSASDFRVNLCSLYTFTGNYSTAHARCLEETLYI